MNTPTKKKQASPESVRSVADAAAELLENAEQLIQQYEQIGANVSSADLKSTTFSLRLVETEAGFDRLQADWNRIASEPMQSFAWHRQWWKAFGTPGALRVICIEANDETIGIAPFFEDRWLGQTRLRFIGSGHVCTDYLHVIAAADDRKTCVAWLTDELKRRQTFDLIELEGVDERGPADELTNQLDDLFWRYQKTIDACWFLKLPPSWDLFLKAASKSLRRKIRKAEKRIASEEVEICSTDEGLAFEEAFEHLVNLHQLRFESKGEPGVFADGRFRSFLENAVRELCQTNLAEIVVGYSGGEPFAAQLYLQGESGPQLYQSGLQPERMDLEPGHLMFTHAIKKAIRRGCREFDFLRGDEAYKPFWGAAPRPLLNVRLVSKRLKPTLINQAYRWARWAKRSLVN